MPDLTPAEKAAAEAIEVTSPTPLSDRQRDRMARAAIRAARSLIGAESVAAARPHIEAETLREAAALVVESAGRSLAAVTVMEWLERRAAEIEAGAADE